MFKLKELRIENGMKRSDFAKAIDLPVTTVANYENETRQAPYELLIRFAQFFNVSVDYLLGVENDLNERIEKNNELLLSQNEKELLKTYRKCAQLGKSRILEYAKMWSETKNE